MSVRRLLVIGLLAAPAVQGAAIRTPDETLTLWPGTAPGASQAKGPEKKVEGRPRPFFQLTDIATPVLEMFHAPADQRNGAAVLVCPGGGLQRLAYEHEGLEVAAWLNSQGITAGVLKYRVPAPAATGLIDAQRAMGLIRANADRWGINPGSLGFIGFSAGGEIGAWLITHAEPRAYEMVDAADQQSCRPDFAALIYSGGLLGRGGTLKESIATNLTASLPPVFLAHAFDDAAENTLQLAVALKRARVPTELHLFHEGAHGFGVRDTGLPVGGWKERLTAWADALGHLDSTPTRKLAAANLAAAKAGSAPVTFAQAWPEGTFTDAYRVQRRMVRALTGNGQQVAGYKGAGASAAAQEAMGIDAPLTGVLFRGGRIDVGDESVTIQRAPGEQIVVETEIGYVMGVDFSFTVPTSAHARDAVAAVVPVIELPRAFGPADARPDPQTMVAGNIGSARYIVGKSIAPGTTNPEQWKISLARNGQLLHETTGASAKGGQWENLLSILNQITAQGYVIRQGDLIICGALGKVHPGEPGKYRAQFGDAATVEFEVR